MLNDSAFEREETPHTINPTQNDTLKVNRFLAVGLRHTDEDLATEEKVEVLAEIICRSGSGDDRATRSAALLVLIAAIESSPHPKALAAVTKQLAFARCSEMNVCGMVESQIAVFERELFAGSTLAA